MPSSLLRISGVVAVLLVGCVSAPVDAQEIFESTPLCVLPEGQFRDGRSLPQTAPDRCSGDRSSTMGLRHARIQFPTPFVTAEWGDAPQRGAALADVRASLARQLAEKKRRGRTFMIVGGAAFIGGGIVGGGGGALIALGGVGVGAYGLILFLDEDPSM